MNFESQYLKVFDRVRGRKDLFTLKGNFILIEKLPDVEIKTKSGLFVGVKGPQMQLGTLNDNVPNACVVLEVGEGYFGDDGKPMEGSLGVEPGDVIILPKHAINYFSLFPALVNYTPNTIGLTRDDSAQFVFKGLDKYNEYCSLLNKEEGV